MPLPSEPVEFPIWRGRRGLINTVLCGILGLVCAIGLAEFAEHKVVVPKCTAYGENLGMTYSSYTIYTGGRHGTGQCSFKTKRGGTEDVSIEEATSLFTDLWLGIAFQLDLTIPVFILLFAIMRSIPYFKSAKK